MSSEDLNIDEFSDDVKTLTWSLTANDKNKVEFEFAFPETKEEVKENTKTAITTSATNIFIYFFQDMNNEKIMTPGLIAGGSLTLVVATIAYFVSNKRNN